MELVDWTDPDPGIGRFDVILACDVLYDKEAIQPMADLVLKLISDSGGRFILADPESRTESHRCLTALSDFQHVSNSCWQSNLQCFFRKRSQSHIAKILFVIHIVIFVHKSLADTAFKAINTCD